MAACPSCGTRVAAAAKFCGACGAKLLGPAPTAPRTASAAAPSPTGVAGSRGLRYLGYAGFGTVIFILALLQMALFIRTGGIATFLIGGIAAVLPVPIYGSLILWLDRHEREPAGLLLATFLWGAVIATFFSLIANTAIGTLIASVAGQQAAGLLTGPLVAPVVEETAKGAALLLLFFFMRHEFDNVLDGIIYGAVVGLGFAMTENVLYFMRALQAGGLVGLGANFYGRVIMFGLGHAMFTGMTGLGLGLARETDKPAVRALAPIGGYSAGVIFHALWNFGAAFFVGMLSQQVSPLVTMLVLLPLQTMILGLPGILTLAIIAFMTWRRESRIISEELGDEVANGVITSQEFALISSGRERMRRLLKTLATQGVQAWASLRLLYDLQTELAFRKWHSRRGDRLPASQRHLSEDAYRQQIRSLRARLQSLGVPTA